MYVKHKQLSFQKFCFKRGMLGKRESVITICVFRKGYLYP